MPRRNRQKNFRLPAETLRELEEIAGRLPDRLTGEPASQTDAVIVAVKVAHKQIVPTAPLTTEPAEV